MQLMSRRRSVLVVDDDPAILDALDGVLRDAGYEVTCASNGQEGLRIIQSSPLPDAILLDLFMPAMNGWEFAKEVAKGGASADVPIIVITAVQPHWGYPAPARRVVHKPIHLEKLLRMLRKVCGDEPDTPQP
jgi:CheY-like chemotaxis protein